MLTNRRAARGPTHTMTATATVPGPTSGDP